MDQSVSPPPDEQADDTEFATVASAATVEAAKKKALEQLRKVVPYVREDDIEFLVVDEGGQGGFLGMGKSQPRVEARVLPGAAPAVGDVIDADEALEKLDEFVTHVTSGMGLDVEVEVSQAGETVVVMDRDHPVARLIPLEEKKSTEVREPLQAFGFQRLAPLVSGGSLEALFEDRGKR